LVSRLRDGQADSLKTIRFELVARLRARLTEIEDAIFARARTLSESVGEEDPEYVAGLRATVSESLDFALVHIEKGEEWTGPIPSTAAEQARRSAQAGVRLDTVLRRYAAGDRLLGDFIMDEDDRFPSQDLRKVLRVHGPQVDRLMAAVATEYMDEVLSAVGCDLTAEEAATLQPMPWWGGLIVCAFILFFALLFLRLVFPETFGVSQTTV